MKVSLSLNGVALLSSKVVIPTGMYNFEITAADIGETKKKDGHFLKVTMKVIGGEQAGHAGKELVEHFNIVNPNQDAVRIGLSGIKTIMTAGGHKNPNHLEDTNELIGLKFNAFVEEQASQFKAQDGTVVDTTENRFRAYMPYAELVVVEGAAPAPAAKKGKKAAEAAPAAPSNLPWTQPAAPVQPATPAPAFVAPTTNPAVPAAPVQPQMPPVVEQPVQPSAPAQAAAGAFPWSR